MIDQNSCAEQQDIVAALRRATLLLIEHGDAEVKQFASRFDVWLAQSPGEVVTFDQAVGLAPTWRSDYRRAERDHALTRLRARHCPTLYGREAARAVITEVSRYEATGWLRDRRNHRRPDGAAGLAFDVLIHGTVPGIERLRHLFPITLANHEQLDVAG